MHLLSISGGMGFALINKCISLVVYLIREVKAVTEVHLFSCQIMLEVMNPLHVDNPSAVVLQSSTITVKLKCSGNWKCCHILRHFFYSEIYFNLWCIFSS